MDLSNINFNINTYEDLIIANLIYEQQVNISLRENQNPSLEPDNEHVLDFQQDNRILQAREPTSFRRESELPKSGPSGKISIKSLTISKKTIKKIFDRCKLSKVLSTKCHRGIRFKFLSRNVHIDRIADSNWRALAQIVPETIARAIFWDRGIEFPQIHLVQGIQKIYSQIVTSDSLNQLIEDVDQFAYMMLSEQMQLSWSYGNRLDFSVVKNALSNPTEDLRNRYSQIRDVFFREEKRRDYIYQLIERNPIRIRGFATSDGRHCYINTIGSTRPRDQFGVIFHELTHAYLKMKKVQPFYLEEGLCDYVKWWVLVHILDLDEKIATSYLSKLPKYKHGFEQIKRDYGKCSDLKKVIDQYSKNLINDPLFIFEGFLD